MEATAQATHEAMADVAQYVDDFPTLPDVAMTVFQELRSDDFDLPAVADTIALDPVLSARLLKLARSPLFGAVPHEESITAAILRLGAKQTRDTVLTVSVMSSIPALPEPLSLVGFWTLGLGTALSARQLARDLGRPSPDHAYIAGLVHSLGEAYLAINFTERFRAAAAAAQAEAITYDAALLREFGIAHTALSARLCRAWNLPEDVVAAVGSHLEPSRAEGDNRFPSVIFAADRICRDLGLGSRDPGHVDRAWVSEIPLELLTAIETLGYPDVTFYLIEHREFLVEVESIVRATFNGRN